MPRLLWLLTIALACRGGSSGPEDQAGQLTAEWTQGNRAVRFSAPAEARWCARDSSLEILAVQGDTGVGMALYAPDTLRAGIYPVRPAASYTPARPQATAALRLVQPAQLLGFESTGGTVTLSETGGGPLSASFVMELRSQVGSDSLTLRGTFNGLSVLPAAASCGRAHKPGGR